MKVGLISDVHANVLALEAVVEQLKLRGAETIVCLGDLVGYGPSPNETIDLVRREGFVCTLGAADERLAFPFARRKAVRHGVADETIEWTKGVIEERHLTFLQSLPVQRRMETPAGWLRFFHGSFEDPSERVNLDRDPFTLTRLLKNHKAKVLAAGSTHVPFYREIEGVGWVVNPGSVGLSLNGEPGADYALLELTEDGVNIEMDKVEYDFAAVAFDIVAWGLPSMVAEAIQMGRLPEKLRSSEDY